MSDAPRDETIAAAPEDSRHQLEVERDHLREQLTDLTGGSFDDNFADSGQVAAEKGESRVLASQLRDQLDDVEAALGRLDDGSYGQCEMCGGSIGEGRLEVMPAARHCIDHAR
jgi:RNA polymerase-binding transcription factor DksA